MTITSIESLDEMRARTLFLFQEYGSPKAAEMWDSLPPDNWVDGYNLTQGGKFYYRKLARAIREADDAAGIRYQFKDTVLMPFSVQEAKVMNLLSEKYLEANDPNFKKFAAQGKSE